MANLIWFRNDLRVKDQHSVYRALQSKKPTFALYCFDPRHFEMDKWGFKKTEKFRAKFLIETVKELKESLDKLNIPLFIYQAKPEDVIPEIIKEHTIDTIFCQKEWTQEEVDVVNNIQNLVDVQWNENYDQFLFHPEDIPFSGVQEIPQVFTAFRKKCEKQSKVRSLLPLPTAQEQTINFSNPTTIPSLTDLGFTPFEVDHRSAFPWSGGEVAAMERLEFYFWESHNLAYYKKTRNGLLGQDYSSKFSPWLANGSISARQIYWEIKRFEKQVKKNQDTYWLIFELIWRDYFKYVSLKHGDAIFYRGGILNRDYDWHNNKAALHDWVNGNTPYDFVNANMIELKETGWMSNRGRQNVASYWAKELKQDWRIGAAYFESMLLDYDVHSNYGNWMYNAGVGNDPRDRKFNIQRQAQMYDAQGKYVQRWLQETLF